MTAYREHDTSALNASQHCAARLIAEIERYVLTIKGQADRGENEARNHSGLNYQESFSII